MLSVAVSTAVAVTLACAAAASPARPAQRARGALSPDRASTTTTTTTTNTASTTEPPGSVPGSTVVEFFEPWEGGRLERSLHVAATVSGSCFSGSLAVDDPRAWRCMTGDRILDPCFAPPATSRPRDLACGSPWTALTMLRLTDPLPEAAADRPPGPTAGWLLQLANGARCQLAAGASGRVDGVAIAYVCSNGAAAGELDWAQEPWSVRYLSPSRRLSESEPVAIAWGG
jgi:hypothetical protein